MTANRFPISFADGSVALAVRAGPGVDLAAALRGMGLTTGVPTLVLVGPGTRPSQLSRLGPLLEKVVIRVAEAVGATVVDEGAADGLPALLGAARRRKKAEFPLVGVAPDPGEGLDPQHTHFVLAPAPAGGIGPWIATVADALAGGNRSVALVAAGGEPAWAAVAAQMAAGRQVLVVSHSGGVADHLIDGPRRVEALADELQAHPPALSRLLRTLSSLGVFTEVEPGTVALTPLGATLVTDAPGSVRDLALMWMETHYAAFGHLVEGVRTGRPAAELHYGAPFFQWISGEPERPWPTTAAMLGSR